MSSKDGNYSSLQVGPEGLEHVLDKEEQMPLRYAIISQLSNPYPNHGPGSSSLCCKGETMS